MPNLEPHYTYLAREFAAARAAPLSLRKALLVVMLADAYADRLFAADPEADDILVFRDTLARRSPALALVFDLALPRDNGPRLVIEPVEIPIADYGKLGVADFMVSLYNRHTVQRVRIALPDGSLLDVHEVLEATIAVLGGPRS
jgi:hypothetical protein